MNWDKIATIFLVIVVIVIFVGGMILLYSGAAWS